MLYACHIYRRSCAFTLLAHPFPKAERKYTPVRAPVTKSRLQYILLIIWKVSHSEPCWLPSQSTVKYWKIQSRLSHSSNSDSTVHAWYSGGIHISSVILDLICNIPPNNHLLTIIATHAYDIGTLSDVLLRFGGAGCHGCICLKPPITPLSISVRAMLVSFYVRLVVGLRASAETVLDCSARVGITLLYW